MLKAERKQFLFESGARQRIRNTENFVGKCKTFFFFPLLNLSERESTNLKEKQQK